MTTPCREQLIHQICFHWFTATEKSKEESGIVDLLSSDLVRFMEHSCMVTSITTTASMMKVNVMAITTMAMTLTASLGYGYRDEVSIEVEIN